MKLEIKWSTIENWHNDPPTQLRQHAFKKEEDQNISLCGRFIHYNDRGNHATIKDIPNEPIDNGCCKHCLKAFNKLIL